MTFSRRMYVPFHDDGIISQFEGYDVLRELEWEKYRTRYENLQRLVLILSPTPWTGTTRVPIEFSANELSIIGEKARAANPALKPLEFLIGEWRTTGSHPEMAGKVLKGSTFFFLARGGAFLIMRTQVDEPEFPDGLAIIGSDNLAGTIAMIYFDSAASPAFTT